MHVDADEKMIDAPIFSVRPRNPAGGVPVVGSSPDRQVLAEAMTRHLRNLASGAVSDRSAMREDAIDQIVGVLERAMRP
ncbi:MAG: hypothetical protein V4724_40070 [Pseudomonadota bacterium]